MTSSVSSVAMGVGADLVVTWEMSHNQCSVCEGVTVILTDHSNTERGYLTRARVPLAAGKKLRIEYHNMTQLVAPNPSHLTGHCLLVDMKHNADF